MSKEFYEKLNKIQVTLSAPKNQRNSFGNYNYRSCEDIFEGIKKVAANTGLAIVVSDELMFVGDKVICKATAKITDGECSETGIGYAMIDNHKGMSAEQTFGTASSYARKYALNGLFLIDDNKDPDSTEVTKADSTLRETKKTENTAKNESFNTAKVSSKKPNDGESEQEETEVKMISKENMMIFLKWKDNVQKWFLDYFKIGSVGEMTADQYSWCLNFYNERILPKMQAAAEKENK